MTNQTRHIDMQLDTLADSCILLTLATKPWNSMLQSAGMKFCSKELTGFNNTATFFVVIQKLLPHRIASQQVLVACKQTGDETT